MINDIEKNIETENKLTRRYADCISTIGIGNYCLKSEIEKLNLRQMYSKGFANFNFL